MSLDSTPDAHGLEIPGFPSYLATRSGAILTYRKWDWRPMKTYIDYQGYHEVKLRADNRRYTRKVHCLILETWVGPRPSGMVACHNDGNPGNNHIDNLRWDTQKANAEDAKKHGRIGPLRREPMTDKAKIASLTRHVFRLQEENRWLRVQLYCKGGIMWADTYPGASDAQANGR